MACDLAETSPDRGGNGDIADKGDAHRLNASGYVGLTSLYVHLISIGAPRVKGMGRAEPKQWLG